MAHMPLAARSLDQLCQAILAAPDLDPRKRQEVASALRALAKALRLPMASISTLPADLVRLLKDFTPALAGFSAGRWRNAVSLTRFALAWAGLCTVPARFNQALSPAWAALIDQLNGPGDRYKLGHLGRYCTAAGIPPVQVDDQVMSNFLSDLQTRSLASDPRRKHRDAAMAWNRIVAACTEWPQQVVLVPDNCHCFALPWTSFPSTLKDDADAYFDRLAAPDPCGESPFDPLRPASIKTRKKQLHLYISALVLQGVAAKELRTLADVVRLEHVAKGLEFYWNRAGKQASQHGGQIAGLIRSIAKHWVKVDSVRVDRLKAMARRITPRQSGMTTRNKDRLRPLADPKALAGLLTLPGCIRKEVTAAGMPTRSLALQLQTALAIEILLMTSIRIRNLSELKIGKNLIRGRDGGVTLVLFEDEVKNRVEHEVVLPDQTVRLLDLYLAKYWPLLAGHDAIFLLPGKQPGKPKCQDGIRQPLQDMIRKRCGLSFHPHLCRHLGAMILLKQNPGAYGQVQRMLGHKSINTTAAFYTGMETAAVMEHYHAHVAFLRGDAISMLAVVRRARRPRS